MSRGSGRSPAGGEVSGHDQQRKQQSEAGGGAGGGGFRESKQEGADRRENELDRKGQKSSGEEEKVETNCVSAYITAGYAHTEAQKHTQRRFSFYFYGALGNAAPVKCISCSTQIKPHPPHPPSSTRRSTRESSEVNSTNRCAWECEMHVYCADGAIQSIYRPVYAAREWLVELNGVSSKHKVAQGPGAMLVRGVFFKVGGLTNSKCSNPHLRVH